MNGLVKRCGQLIFKCVFLLFVSATVHAVDIPPVQNVQLNGNQLTWDAVEGTTGYNIHVGSRYVNTVRGERRFTVVETGNYGVVAFNDEGDFGPLRGSSFQFFEGGVDNRPRVTEVGEGNAILTQRCFDLDAGESCTARCPDFIGGVVGLASGVSIRGATGGACSSSDTANINASIVGTREYVCTVSRFTSRVESQVACLIEE